MIGSRAVVWVTTVEVYGVYYELEGSREETNMAHFVAWIAVGIASALVDVTELETLVRGDSPLESVSCSIAYDPTGLPRYCLLESSPWYLSE